MVRDRFSQNITHPMQPIANCVLFSLANPMTQQYWSFFQSNNPRLQHLQQSNPFGCMYILGITGFQAELALVVHAYFLLKLRE